MKHRPALALLLLLSIAAIFGCQSNNDVGGYVPQPLEEDEPAGHVPQPIEND